MPVRSSSIRRVAVADRLYRSRDDRMLAGVAGGVAEMLDADPSIIRIIWALLVFLTGGLALLVYVVMAIVVPERPEGMPIGSPWAPGSETPGQDAATPDAGTVPEGGWRAPDGSTVPIGAAAPSSGRRRRDPADRARGGVVVGLLFILIGGFFLIRQLVPAFDLGLWWPTVAIGVGILLVILALLPPRHSS
jgi:phage shock protein C